MSAPAWLDEHMPPVGRCELCGNPDARHRVLDSIAERIRAGELVSAVADDYELPDDVVRRIADEWVGDGIDC